jgi:hypothetical protein
METDMTLEQAETITEAQTRTKLRDIERAVCDLVALTIGFTKADQKQTGIVDLRELLAQRRDLKEQLLVDAA